MLPQERITRRHLPHWYVPGAAHFVTYRLAGTLPATVLQSLGAQKEALLRRGPPKGDEAARWRDRAHKLFFAAYDRYLDTTSGIDWLTRPAVAAMIRANLYHRNGRKYHLLAYCIMPNHVHVLLQPVPEPKAAAEEGQAGLLVPTGGEVSGEVVDVRSPLAGIMHSLKSYTANRANQLLRRSGQFWQHESYDHWVRDEDELERIVDYIGGNPIKANRARQPQDWFFCSAHDRFLQDGSNSSWLLDRSAPP